MKEDAFRCREGVKSCSCQSTNGQRLFFPEDQHLQSVWDQLQAVCRAHRTNNLNKDAAVVGKEPPWERNLQGIPQQWQGKKAGLNRWQIHRDCLRKSSAAHQGTFFRDTALQQAQQILVRDCHWENNDLGSISGFIYDHLPLLCAQKDSATLNNTMIITSLMVLLQSTTSPGKKEAAASSVLASKGTMLGFQAISFEPASHQAAHRKKPSSCRRKQMYLLLLEFIPLNTTIQWSLKLGTMMSNEDAAI